MQKKYSSLFILSLALLCKVTSAQETIYPTGPQQGTTAITHATVHVGNGTVLNDATVIFEKGKIKTRDWNATGCSVAENRT